MPSLASHILPPPPPASRSQERTAGVWVRQCWYRVGLGSSSLARLRCPSYPPTYSSDHSNMSLNPCREFNCFREVHHYGRHLSSMLKRVARAQERSMLAHWNLTVQRTAKPAAKLFQVWVWTSRRQQLETRDLLSICESNFKSDLRSLARKKHIELCYLQGQSKESFNL